MENYRNIWCPYYDYCLDETIQHDRTGFTCNGCDNQFVKKYPTDVERLEENMTTLRGFHLAYKIYKDAYRTGPDERLDAFAEYAYKVLPEEISEKAIPDYSTLKRLNIPREPKKHPQEGDITHVNTLGPAHINPDWQYCGDEDLAEYLGKSKSWVEKGKSEGWLAHDRWNGFSWYAQNSTDFVKQLIDSGQVKRYKKSWRTDTTCPPNF